MRRAGRFPPDEAAPIQTFFLPKPSKVESTMQTPVTERPEATAPEALVSQAQSGDLDAFEALYRQQVGRVYGLCLRFTAEPGRAEELTQDIFIRLWEKLPGFRGESAFTTWLHRLSVNVVLDRLRAEGRRAAWMTVTDDLAAFDGPAVTAEPGTRLDLEKALAALPAGARTVFLLHDVEGYRHEEIAELIGVAVGTSKAQLHRARRLLREVLER